VETVKRTDISACCLLMMVLQVSGRALESLGVVRPEPSNQKAKIVTLLGGRPQEGVTVDVYRYSLGSGEESVTVVSLISDDVGSVRTPVLPPGKYHLVAAGGHNLRADLYLDILGKSGDEVSFFSMELFDAEYPTMEQKWAAADELAVKDHVGFFNGTIYDSTGAVVPAVSIEVVKRGTSGKQRIAQLASSYDGKFSAQLPEGAYIALFSVRGFRIAFVPFEVAKQGSGQLRVTLQLGSTTQTVVVTGRGPSPGTVGSPASNYTPTTNN
jgi:hypothetical protein